MSISSITVPPILLLDIEGTTTSISFVKDVLFPYAKTKIESFIRQHWAEWEIQTIVSDLRKQSEEDVKQGLLAKPLLDPEIENDEEKLIKDVVDNLLWQIDNDRKTTGLKQLQGKIWQDGYLEGVLKGHVYADVSTAFAKWVQSRRKIYIYSSGSVQAQILLFQHSEAGDLTMHLAGHFDTTSGPKVEVKSYLNIARKIGTPASDILFLTDIPKEAYAAKEAGLQVVVIVRPGNSPLSSNERNDFVTAQSFEEFSYNKL